MTDEFHRDAFGDADAHERTDGRTLGDRTYPSNRDYAADLGGVIRVGLIRFHGSPRPPTSACDHKRLQAFFDGPVWRYAAGLAGAAVICRSAYC